MKQRLLKPAKPLNPECRRWMDGFVIVKSKKDDLEISQARARLEISVRKAKNRKIRVTEG